MGTLSGHLPDDVMVEILSRLPVKSLFRFSCVSKQWLTSISSPSTTHGSIRHLHDHRNNRNPFLVRRSVWDKIYGTAYRERGSWRNSTFRIELVDMIAEKVHHEFKIDLYGGWFNSVICCQGLICLILSETVYVCNPSTDELVLVPGCDEKRRSWFTLGYLPSTKQYKLLRCFVLDDSNSDDKHVMGCEIFIITDGGKVEYGSWRVTRNVPCVGGYYTDGICVNGVIYWRILHSERTNPNANLLLSFDLDTEEYELVQFPESDLLGVNRSTYLLEMKGSLCLVLQYDLDDISIRIKSWFMKGRKDWVEGYDINIATAHDPARLLAYKPGGDNGEELVLLSREEGIIYYNVRNKSFRRPEKLSHLRPLNHGWPLQCYDSFFSLGSV